MKIYNLFPLLAGRFEDWGPHLERAAAMGFDWIFVNPIQKPGQSGSLYSIADYFVINPALLNPKSIAAPQAQVQATVAAAERLGLSMMIDLVINHCAMDSPLVREHPDWFLRDGGQAASAFCVEADGRRVVWRDLAQFDHRGSPDREALFDHCARVVEHLIELGFRGFRCDAAYQLPTEFWKRLIARIHARRPDIRFVAETLGCSPEQTRDTAAAGFDAIFNSGKWWDFDSPWLLEQYELTRRTAPSIGFPESHDTRRLFDESGGNVEVMRQRYLFAALFSAGVMLPIGYEYGFRRQLDVVGTRPEHWETPTLDLTGFIAQVNAIKDRFPLFNEDGPIARLDSPNPAVLILRKSAVAGRDAALLILNKDPWNRQHLRIEDLYRLLPGAAALIDASPDWPMDFLPTPFEFELGPGMARVLVAAPPAASTGETGKAQPAINRRKP